MTLYDKLEMINFLLDLSEKIMNLNNVVLEFLVDIYEDVFPEGVTNDESKR